MASDSWFYSDGGKSFGPVDEEAVQSLIADGTVGRDHFVMEEGKEDWEKVSESRFSKLLDQIWYHSDTRETFGPCSEADLRELIESGLVAADHFVMRASEEDWTPLAESKFASAKIKGPKPPSGVVTPTPLRRLPTASPSRTKAEIRIGSSDAETPPSSKKSAETKPKKTSESKANVPANEIPPKDKLKKLSAELTATKKESEAWMHRVAEAEKAREDALKEGQIATKKLTKIETEWLQLNKQFDRSVSEACKMKADLATLREDLEIAEKKLGASNASKAELSKRIADLEAQLAAPPKPDPIQEKQIAELADSLEETKRQLGATQDQLAEAKTGAETNKTPDSNQSEKIKLLRTELLETTSLLAKAKERQPAQENKIRELESELAKALSQLADAQKTVEELSNRLQELESQLDQAELPAIPTHGSDPKLQDLVPSLQAKLAEAEEEAKSAQADLAKAKIRLRELQSTRGASASLAKSPKLVWAAAAVALLFAIGAGGFAWIEHRRANNLADGSSSNQDLATAKSALAEARSELETFKAAGAGTPGGDSKNHAAFAAQLLDKIASVSGPIDPDLIAQWRRETEDHFGLKNNIAPLDAETAERAAQMISDGDVAHSAGKFADARNSYRDASLLISPLLETYPSQAFWRGDLISAHTRHARAELALKKPAEADQALKKAEVQLEILRSDDPERAAIRTGELADVWETTGDDAMATGDVGRARTAFEHALAFRAAVKPGSDSAALRKLHTKLGDLSVSTGNLTAAHESYLKANASNPVETERISLLENLAMVERKLGLLPGAAAKAEELLTYHRAVAEKQPSPATLRGFAKTSNLVGEIRRDSGDFPGAIAAHADATTVLQNLIALDAQDLDTQRELAITGIRIGEVEMVQKNYAAARARFEENLPTLRMLVTREPEDIGALKDLEYLHLNIARSHAMENNHELALGAYADALRVSELLSAAAPKNLSLTRNLADWKTRIGNYQKSLGKPDLARENLRDALRTLKILATADASDLETTRQITELNKTLGDLEMALSPEVAVTPEVIDDPKNPGASESQPAQPEEQNQGETYYREAVTKAKELAAQDPENPLAQSELAAAHEKLGAFYMSATRFPDAQAEYLRCLEVRKKLVENTETPEPVWIHDLSRTYYELAFIESQTGTIGIGEQYYISALNHGEAAVAAADKAKGEVPAEWIALNGETYLRLGEIDQAERQFYQARRRFQRAVDILRILTASHDQDDWKISLVLAYAGLATNYEYGDPKNPALAKALHGEALDILKKMNGEGKLTKSEKAWIARLEEKAG